MQAELEALQATLGGAERPAAAVIGGAMVSSKLDVLGHVLDKVDVLIIGGGMANTFLNAQGTDVGKSLCEHDLAATARDIMAKAEARNVAIEMTLTAPGCPVAGQMPAWVENAVGAVAGVGQVEVKMTFDPPWTTDRMSDEARVALGWF